MAAPTIPPTLWADATWISQTYFFGKYFKSMINILPWMFHWLWVVFQNPPLHPQVPSESKKMREEVYISLFFASGTSNPHQLSKRKSTWGRTGLSQVSRLPCERAARQAMAQDAKAIVLEWSVVSSLDIALVSLLDGSEFLLDITNPFPFDMCWRVEVQVLIELSTCDNLNDAPSNNVILLMLLLLLVTVTLTVTVTVTAANRNCERVEPYQYWN